MPFGHSYDDINENEFTHTTHNKSESRVDKLQTEEIGYKDLPYSELDTECINTYNYRNLSHSTDKLLSENNDTCTSFDFQYFPSSDVYAVPEFENPCSALESSCGSDTNVNAALHCNVANKNQLLDIQVADLVCKGTASVDDQELFLNVLECLKTAVSSDNDDVTYCAETCEKESKENVTRELLLSSVCEQNNLTEKLTAYHIPHTYSGTICSYSKDLSSSLSDIVNKCSEINVDNLKCGNHSSDENLDNYDTHNVSNNKIDFNETNESHANLHLNDESENHVGTNCNTFELDLNDKDSCESFLQHICNGNFSNNDVNKHLNYTEDILLNTCKFTKQSSEKDLKYTVDDIYENGLNNGINENINHDDGKADLTESDNCVDVDGKADLTETENCVESPKRPESPEPGTTHVTISDRIKSLILLKLLSMSTAPNAKSESEHKINNKSKSDHTDNLEAKQSKEVSYCCKWMAAISAMAENTNPPTKAAVLGIKSTVATTSSYNVPVIVLGTTHTGESSITMTTSSLQKNITSASPAFVQSNTFSCELCPYFTNNKNYLKQHVDIVHNAHRPYKCPFCGYAGKRSHALREHLIVHSSERPYECNDCNATFRKKGHLTNHIKLHNRKRLVSCPLCKSLVYDQGEQGLDVHLKSAHGTEKLYGCDLCSFIAGSEPEIVKHLNEKHLKVDMFKCAKCSFETSDSVGFESHVKTHNLKVQNSDSCGGKNFSSYSQLANNSSVNAGSPGASNITKPAQRNMPELGQPSVVKPVWIKCTECGFTAQDSEVIRQHMINHIQMTEKSSVSHHHEVSSPVENNISQPEPHITECNMQVNVPHNTKLTLSNIPRQKKEASITASALPPATQTQPLLVPINDFKQLAPYATHSLDLESPILVPVSNAAMLKDVPVVKMSSFQYSPTKAPAKYIRVAATNTDGSGNVSLMPVLQRSPYIDMNHTPKTSPKTTVKSPLASDAINRPVAQMPLTCSRNTDEKYPYIKFPEDSVNSSDSDEPGLEKECDTEICKMKTLTVNSKTIGSLNGGSISKFSGSPVLNVTNCGPQTINKDTLAIADSRSQSATSSSALQAFSGSMVHNFRLTEIPVPRNISINPPKLPPEILMMSENQNKVTSVENVHQTAKEDDKVATLRANLENVQQLILQQDALQKQLGGEGKYLDGKGIPAKSDGKNVVYYITPMAKQNTVQNGANVGFTHDSTAGRFRCTICGYTCEYQRTIKAHIWKHSGNKDIDYPMFQNGPLSIYEEEHLPEDNEPVSDSMAGQTLEISRTSQLNPLPVCVQQIDEEKSPLKDSSKIPPFIIYEETKISPVAPALAHLIAARTMVGLGKNKNENKTNIYTDKVNSEDIHKTRSTGNQNMQEPQQSDLSKYTVKLKRHLPQNDNENSTGDKHTCITVKKQKTDTCLTQSVNVVVESVNSVGTNSLFTGMTSQQNSPRLSAPKSPEETDSGVSEVTTSNVSNTAEESSLSSNLLSPESDRNLIIDESDDLAPENASIKRIEKQSFEMEHMYSKYNETQTTSSIIAEMSAPTCRKRKVSESTAEQAVTLLSLLKKGPNFNPACPPKNFGITQFNTTVHDVNTTSLSADDVATTVESDISEEKPKSGISTSLLAVIEQLRERSKSDIEEEKSASQSAMTKKQSKRRSRRSSVEDNESAEGIGNVEEFVSEGEVKYRCKLCHYANESTVLLRQHMRLHKTKQPFECSLCDFIGESSESLQDHMIQHCKVRTYQCKLCPSAFNYKSQLRAHMRAHNDQDILMCDFCDFETRNQIALKTHMKSHLTKPPYKCEFCREEFITSFNLRVHKREGCNTCTSIDRFGNYKCDDCDFTSLGRREMKNHQRGHSNIKAVNQNNKQCPYCKYTASVVEDVQQHIMDKHGDSKPMKCEMCGFVAVSIRSLKSHMKRHVNDQRFVQQPLEQYKCNLCGYVCHHLPSLKSHMWRHAADEHYSYEFTNEVINAAIDFDCNIEAADTTDENVEEFRKLIYDKMFAKGLEKTRETNEKSAYACCWVTFRCCQCGFETINKAELNRHMCEHSDIIKMTLQVSKKAANNVETDEKTTNDAKN